MPQPIVEQNFQNLLEPGLREVFHVEMQNRAELHKRARLFTTLQSERAFEEHLGIGSLGTDGWDYKARGQVSYDSLNENYKATLRHRSFAKGIIIEREMLDDNLYPGAGIPRSITERAEKLADATETYRELIAAAVFNNISTDSGTTVGGFSLAGPDAVGLASASHPRSSADSATQSNEGSLALSVDNVDSTRQSMRAWTDDRGELISVKPDVLLVPPELEKDALIIQQSQMEPGHANNDANVVGRRVKEVISWDFLTDANAWGMIDDQRRAKHLLWYDRVAPEFAATGDFDSLVAKYRAYFRCGRGWTDWRFIMWQNPS